MKHNSLVRVAGFSVLTLILFALPTKNAFGQCAGLLSSMKQNCKDSAAAFRSAAVLIVGQEAGEEQIKKWLAAAGDAEWKAKLDDGMNVGEAANFLKQRISKPEGADERAMAIDNAYQEVYGRNSTATEQAGWDAQFRAQKAWYAPIVGSESGKLNQNSAEREAVINRVYLKTFGREANKSELKYWLPRTEHFRLIVEANRQWLYSSGGATDLVETIKRSITANSTKNGRPQLIFREETIKEALTKYTPSKAVFDEMK